MLWEVVGESGDTLQSPQRLHTELRRPGPRTNSLYTTHGTVHQAGGHEAPPSSLSCEPLIFDQNYRLQPPLDAPRWSPACCQPFLLRLAAFASDYTVPLCFHNQGSHRGLRSRQLLAWTSSPGCANSGSQMLPWGSVWGLRLCVFVPSPVPRDPPLNIRQAPFRKGENNFSLWSVISFCFFKNTGGRREAFSHFFKEVVAAAIIFPSVLKRQYPTFPFTVPASVQPSLG